MVRATTGGVLKTYRSNLMRSFIASNKARETVVTQRNFNSYAEDPAAAAKAFRLRMSRLTTKSQFDICQDTYYKFQSGFKSLQTVDELIDTENGGNELQTLKSTTLKMLNDPTGDARTQLSKVLGVMSETVVQMMNQKYGDDFIFAGADGQNVPFEVKKTADGKNQLFYRGVPVDTQMPELMTDGATPPKEITMTNGDYVLADADMLEVLNNMTPVKSAADGTEYYVANGATPETTPPADPTAYLQTDDGTYYKMSDLIAKDSYDAKVANAVKNADGTPATATIDGKTCYVMQGGAMTEEEYTKAKTDAEKLEYLANEKRFVDIGLGFQENEKNKLIESSAFNESLNGLTFLGYGLDEEGDPKNIYSIVQRLTEIADSVPDGQDWDSSTYDEFHRLVGKLEDASSEFKTQFANMDAGTLKLENNLSLLEENFYNLDEQTANLEDVDTVEAIENFLWAEYAYNAALKVGNSILSQSLMDYIQ